jgi:predicted DNA-binding transcriptional regulator YafY
MTKTARVYKIEMLIRNRGHVSFQALLDELEVSPATLKRDLDYLKDQLGAPIEYDRFLNGYRFGEEYRGQKHELPGLWFSERELYSLLMAHQLLSELDSEGVISRHLQPLLERIHQMLGTGEADAKALLKRVKIIGSAKRPVSSQFFELIGEALLKRRRIHMRYLTRGRGEVSERDVSPQRLVHYRNTWYVDAWCHTREKMLRFALDAIETPNWLETRSEGGRAQAGARPRWTAATASTPAPSASGPRSASQRASRAVGQPRGMASRSAGPMARRPWRARRHP